MKLEQYFLKHSLKLYKAMTKLLFSEIMQVIELIFGLQASYILN